MIIPGITATGDNTMGNHKSGFAALDPERVREIARKGGIAAQAKGYAHRWDREQAREAGRKGGIAAQRARRLRLGPLAMLLLCLVIPMAAHAAVISPGTWVPIAAPNNDGTPYYDRSSEDCWDCGFQWDAYGFTAEVLLFNGGPAPFKLSGINSFTLGFERADWANLNRSGWYDGAGPGFADVFAPAESQGVTKPANTPATFGIWLLNPRGDLFTSTANPDHFLLTRLVQPGLTIYLLGIEDQKWPAVIDLNDQEWLMTEQTPPSTVPEPTTLTLLGTGLLLARRFRRR